MVKLPSPGSLEQSARITTEMLMGATPPEVDEQLRLPSRWNNQQRTEQAFVVVIGGLLLPGHKPTGEVGQGERCRFSLVTRGAVVLGRPPRAVETGIHDLAKRLGLAPQPRDSPRT
jgi:hypothetical protein